MSMNLREHVGVADVESSLRAKPFISVVMPCFNTADFLSLALDSVFSQHGSACIEVLLVEDASTDGKTLDACRSFAAVDVRVRCLEHGCNKGLAAARNTGLREARGSYVLFMDSDDRLCPGLFDELRRTVSEAEADVIAWGVIEDYYDESGEITYSKEITVPLRVCSSFADRAREAVALEEATLLGYAWNKLYRRDFLLDNDLYFSDVRLIEDILFNIEVVRHANTMLVLDAPYYRYSRRLSDQASLTTKFIPDYFELNTLRIQRMCELCEDAGVFDEGAKGVFGAAYVRYALSALWRNCDSRSEMNGKDRRDWLKEFYDRPLSRMLLSSAAPKGKLARMNAFLFKKHVTSLLLLEAWVIDFTNKHIGFALNRARQSR